jgi:hypothetical protein
MMLLPAGMVREQIHDTPQKIIFTANRANRRSGRPPFAGLTL